mgnify:CR=1 FL=1
MNRVALVGRLTRDPEIRYTPDSQLAITRFTIAVDRVYKKDGQQTADFLPIVVFGKVAENVHKYMRKGRLVSVSVDFNPEPGTTKRVDAITRMR